MEVSRTLFIPVILGTARMGRMSQHAAELVTGELGKCEGVATELIDIAKLPLPTNDAGEAIKHPDFSTKVSKADALVVVSPEYNHGYSGLLKHVLAQKIHKKEDAEALFCYKHVVQSVFAERRKASACPTITQHSVCCFPRYSPSPW